MFGGGADIVEPLATSAAGGSGAAGSYVATPLARGGLAATSYVLPGLPKYAAPFGFPSFGEAQADNPRQIMPAAKIANFMMTSVGAWQQTTS